MCFLVSSQIQNLTNSIDTFLGDVNDMVSNSLRGFVKTPPKKKFIVCDFSQIEARVLAWLAEEEEKLKAFRTDGKIYETAASHMYGIPLSSVTKDQRQTGKVAELAFGYQGGLGAFRQMESTLGLDLGLTDEVVEEFVKEWRKANSNIKQFWHDVEYAAVEAVRNKERAFTVNDKVTFVCKGSFLWCRLPSGRTIKYPFPSLKVVKVTIKAKHKDEEDRTFDKVELRFKAMKNTTRTWERQATYGGKLTENICQAVARDFLGWAMLRLDKAGYKIIGHVHDEVIIEASLEERVKDVEDIMCEIPQWGEGCPIAAEGFEDFRYRK